VLTPGQPTSGELAEIEALVAHAGRLLSTCHEGGFHHPTATIEHDV